MVCPWEIMLEFSDELGDLISHAFTSDSTPIWVYIERVLQLLENDNYEMLKKYKTSEKCHSFFSNVSFFRQKPTFYLFLKIVSYFKPSNQKLTSESIDRSKIRCGCRVFYLLTTLSIEPYYSQIMNEFISNFCEQLEPVGVFLRSKKISA